MNTILHVPGSGYNLRIPYIPYYLNTWDQIFPGVNLLHLIHWSWNSFTKDLQEILPSSLPPLQYYQCLYSLDSISNATVREYCTGLALADLHAHLKLTVQKSKLH